MEKKTLLLWYEEDYYLFGEYNLPNVHHWISLQQQSDLNIIQRMSVFLVEKLFIWLNYMINDHNPLNNKKKTDHGETESS